MAEEIQNLNIENIKNLVGIGTKIEDFEPIKSENQDFTLLGRDKFGYTEKMKSKLNNQIYAVQKILVKREGFPRSLIRAITIMIELNNEYILKIYGYFQGNINLEKLKIIFKDNFNDLYQNESNEKIMYYFILEFVPNGSLDNYLNKCRGLKVEIPQEFVIKIFKQLLIAINYLHSRQLIHNDIKLDTILLDENNNAKIKFNDISKLYRESSEENNLNSNLTLLGHRDIIAPEILNGMNFDLKVDVFSLGLTMLCLISKKYPILFTNSKRKIIFEYIDENIYNENLINLIKKMIKENPMQRPNIGEALEELYKIENVSV